MPSSSISRRFPLAHGGPGAFRRSGRDRHRRHLSPDWGDPVPLPEGHVPVFWACGVTPQVAMEEAGLPIFISHKPGHMLITDVPEDAEIPIISAKAK